MAQVPGTVTDAENELKKYPNIAAIIDLAKFRAQVAKKYPSGPELNDDEVSDLFIALLLSRIPLFQQGTSNAASPEGALIGMDKALPTFQLSAKDSKVLGDKLVNLRTSSFWDTLTEILVLKTMLSNLPSHRVGTEELLGAVGAKDADFALYDDKGNVSVFIDAVTPQASSSSEPAQQQITNWIAKKYDTKFSKFCQQNPTARVAVIVSLLKNEHFYAEYFTKIKSGGVSTLQDQILDSKQGLVLGIACSFRCPPPHNDLVIDHLTKYERK